jgi:hypothetical protein
MKIQNEQVAHLLEQTQPKKAQSTLSEAGRTFGDTLAQKLEGAPAPVTEFDRPLIVNHVVGGGDSEIPAEWFQINGVVDSMDRYGEALGNPTYSLKEIEPLAAEMEEQAATLRSQLEKGGFGSLRQVAEETVAQAQIAAIKFRRGDYV